MSVYPAYNKMEIFSLSGDFRTEGDSSASMEAMMGFSGFGECFFKDGANIHRNLWITFFIVKVASGIARGCVCTTTIKTMSHNMAAIFQLIGHAA